MRNFNSLELISAINNGTDLVFDGETVKLDGTNTYGIGFDMKSDKIVILNSEMAMPKGVVRIIEALRIDKNTIFFKMEDKSGITYSKKFMTRVIAVLNTYLTQTKQFVTTAFAAQINELDWSAYVGTTDNGKINFKNIGKISLQYSNDQKFGLLADGTVGLITLDQLNEYIAMPVNSKLTKILKDGKYVGVGYVLERTFGNIALVAINGQQTIVFNTDLESEKYDTKGFYMTAIDADGTPVNGKINILGLPESGIVDVKVGVDLKAVNNPNKFVERFTQAIAS